MSLSPVPKRAPNAPTSFPGPFRWQGQGPGDEVANAHALSPQITGHTSVYINEPRLSDFKQVLNKAGIQAEFAGGVLICNNVVAVRRVSNVVQKF